MNDSISIENLYQILDQIGFGVIITDANGIILMCNDSYIQICEFHKFGFSSESIIGNAVTEGVAKSGYGWHSSAVIKTIKSGKPEKTIFSAAFYKLVLSRATPIFDDCGNLRYVCCVVSNEPDIFQLKEKYPDFEEIYSDYLQSAALTGDTDLPVIVSAPMKKVMERSSIVLSSDIPVLLLGESGVGKDVVSKYIHRSSQRKDKPFIVVNCGAIPENLIESELFGYAPGAFTGADKKGKCGFFEEADGGTIMLDEIGDLPVAMQVKLLRVLEQQEFTRIGSTKVIRTNFRLISATNKDLSAMVEENLFREDLYYRINGFRIVIPPLRERIDDISPLATHFLLTYNFKYNSSATLTEDAVTQLERYRWPGNVRELRNTVEQLMVISQLSGGVIDGDLVTQILHGMDDPDPAVKVNNIIPLKEAVSTVERELLQQAIRQEGSTYRAAKVLGVDQSTVVRKMQKYHIGEKEPGKDPKNDKKRRP